VQRLAFVTLCILLDASHSYSDTIRKIFLVIEITFEAVQRKLPINTELFQEMIVIIIQANHATMSENTCKERGTLT